MQIFQGAKQAQLVIPMFIRLVRFSPEEANWQNIPLVPIDQTDFV
jgi:hypothetical protein